MTIQALVLLVLAALTPLWTLTEGVEDYMLAGVSQKVLDRLPTDQLRRQQRKFAFLDSDANGKITKEELFEGLRLMNQNPTEAKLKHILEELDLNEDGGISFEEFLHPTCEQHAEEEHLLHPSAMEEAFEKLDVNDDNYIDTQELKSGLKGQLEHPLKDSDASAFIEKYLDKDDDGRVSLIEFRNYF